MSAILVVPPAPSPGVPHNVPTALTGFVGRARDLAEVARLLGEGRLVTLTGAGGAGKTRLAREVAARLAAGAVAAPTGGDAGADAGADALAGTAEWAIPRPEELAPAAAGPTDGAAAFAAGVWWVELAPLPPGSDVAAAVAAVLGVRQAPSPADGTTPERAIAGAIGARPMLLVLDNCEHVLDAAAALADALLRACPHLRVLASSREALGVEGEVAWPVPPLSHPAVRGHGAGVSIAAAGESLAGEALVEALGGFDAVRLFVERASAASPAFALTARTAPAVATICARLDGLPLALELAAANVGVLGLEQTAARLDDAFAVLTRGRRTALPRHRTLRALLDWSYQLLGAGERTLLRRLSVFRDAFTLDDVVAVCAPLDDAPGDGPVLEALGRLVEQSLVAVREDRDGTARFRLLETVRQYGAALLRGTDDDEATRGRHAAWVAAMVDALAPRLWSVDRRRACAEALLVVDDIAAALAWAVAEVPDAEARRARAVTALRIAGALTWFYLSTGRWEDGRRAYAASLDAAARAGLDVAVADGGGASRAERTALGAAEYLGAVMAWLDGDYPVARHRAARAAALWAALETLLATLPDADAARRWATLKLGLALEIEAQAIAMLGDPQAGLAVMDRAVASAERTGDARHLAAVSARRGFVRMAVGDAAGAEADFAAAVRTYRAIGEGWLLSLAYQGMAVHALALDRVPEALARARACVAVVRDEGNSWFLSRGLDTLAAALVRAAPQATGDDAARLALATELLGAADGLRRRTGVVLSPYDQAMQAGAVEAARARLGPDAFEAAWTRGGTLPEAALLARVTESVTEGERAVDADAPLAPATTAAAAVPATTAHPVTPHPAPTPAAPTVTVAAAPAPPALQLLAFGPLAVVRAGVVLPSGEMSPAKARELLLYLLLHPPRTKEQVALVLWPEASEAQVRNAFHVVLHHVRRILGGKDRVTFDGGSYRLARDGAPGGFDADVDAVLAAAEAARAAERRRAPVDAGTRARWAAALGRHERGMLGEGMDAGDWLVAHQDRVRAAWAGGLEALARLHAAAGAQADAAALLETLVARDPLREGAHRALMQAYAAMGEPARALAHHEQLVALLDRELGAKPARETRALADALRQGSGARG